MDGDDKEISVSDTQVVDRLRSEIERAEPSRRSRIIEQFILAALSSIPWVGGVLSAAESVSVPGLGKGGRTRMPADKNPSDDPIIDAVIALNAAHKNTLYSKRSPVKIGNALVYTVVFKGDDGYWYENYVYEKGSKRIAYWDLERMINGRDNDLIPSGRDPDYIRTLVVAAFTLIFGIAVIYVVIRDPKNPSLQVLTGLLGLGIGYFVGTNHPAQKL